VTVKPEVVLGEYRGIELHDDRERFVVDDAAVQEEIDRIRKQHAEIQVVEDGEVQEGDTVNIDFVGTVDGEPFEGGEAENYQLEIGSGLFVQGFEQQLIGMKPGEERDIQITFPDNYHVKSLAGKQATFHVVLHDIKRKALRELNDEFVQEISEFETVDAFVADVRKKLEERAEEDRKRHLEEQAVKAAVDGATIDIPPVMIEHEIDRLVFNFSQQLALQQPPLEPNIRFRRSKPKLWLHRPTLTTSAPTNILLFIEQRLLCLELKAARIHPVDLGPAAPGGRGSVVVSGLGEGLRGGRPNSVWRVGGSPRWDAWVGAHSSVGHCQVRRTNPWPDSRQRLPGSLTHLAGACTSLRDTYRIGCPAQHA
ncbi:MAG: trigger factor, partial [Pirellulales bacterium]|nr:trigger factor [Pirellulales bacterium]